MNLHKGKTIFTILTVIFTLFIFHNSLFPGPESSRQSQNVMDFVNNLLASWKIHYSFTEHIIRKLGHFTEYCAFGTLLTQTIRMYQAEKTQSLFMELFILLLIPVCDEFIQAFVSGRGSSIADVLLDFISGMFAMLIFTLIRMIWLQFRNPA
jgi:VanZ family protein